MGVLKIRLFAGFSVELNGQAVTKFRSTKSRALLSWLACRPDTAHSRDTLATLLWGDSAEKAAKTNLRATLADIKRNLQSHPALEITRQDVRFHSAAATVDVTQFQADLVSIANDSTPSTPQQAESVANALVLYTGEFLTGFTVSDAFEFSDWQLTTQENLHIQAMSAFDWVLNHYSTQRGWAALAQTASQQIALQAWHEPAHRYLIEALAEQGQWAAAKAQYQRCRSILFEELGADPTEETQAFWHELVARFETTAKPRHNLPQSLTPFFGRNEEQTDLIQAFTERRYRLLTLTGLGGSGKTRLALEVAHSQIASFADGVWFISLAEADSAEAILPSIATAVAAATDTNESLETDDQILKWLQTKELLLILDNLEQMPDVGADRIVELLKATENVTILVTSRRRLGLRIETLFPIDGLNYPDESAPPDTLAHFDAVTFFQEQTRRVNPRSKPNLPLYAEICRLLRGLPLGIELTAAQTDRRSLDEITATLQSNLAVLETEMRDVPARQRSLRAVFDSSWMLLTPTEQQTLVRLSVFRGRFADGAALAIVAGLTPKLLDALTGHSLVQAVGDGFYRMHELVRQFSAEKRSSTDATAGQHSRYYLNAIADKQAHADYHDSIGNIRSAWQWIAAQPDLDQIQKSAGPFLEYMQALGRLRESSQMVESTVAAVQAGSTHTEAQRNETYAHLIAASSLITRRIYGLDAVINQLQTALSKTQTPHLKSELHKELAQSLAERGEWSRAVPHFEALEKIARQLNDDEMIVDALSTYAHNATLHFVGDYEQAIKQNLEALAIVEKYGNAKSGQQMRLLNAVNNAYVRHGNYAPAFDICDQLLALASALDNNWFVITGYLNKGLASTFAGYNEQAIECNQNAIKIAREIDDFEGIGLLNANLCLSYRRSGQLEQSRLHGEIAIRQLVALNAARMEGMARNRLSHTLHALGLVAEAQDAYAQAFKMWSAIEHPNVYEAQAGLAATLAESGQLDAAIKHAETVLQFSLEGNLHKVVEPALMLLNCATVFRLAENKKREQLSLTTANDWLQTIAMRNSDEAVRASYLNNVPDHQRLKVLVVAKLN